MTPASGISQNEVDEIAMQLEALLDGSNPDYDSVLRGILEDLPSGDVDDDDEGECPQPDTDPSDYVKKMRREAASKAWKGASKHQTEKVNRGDSP